MTLPSRAIALLLGLTLLAACARGPVVDFETSTAPPQAYEANLAECRRLADQRPVAGSAATGAATGALIGTALGAITGAFAGDPGTGAAIGAATGGAGGGISGTAGGVQERRSIVAQCLSNRGYSVLAP